MVLIAISSVTKASLSSRSLVLRCRSAMPSMTTRS